MKIPFDIQKLRDEVITADEWAGMVDFLRSTDNMTDQEWQQFPEEFRWVQEVYAIAKERVGQTCHLQGCGLAKKESHGEKI